MSGGLSKARHIFTRHVVALYLQRVLPVLVSLIWYDQKHISPAWRDHTQRNSVVNAVSAVPRSSISDLLSTTN